MKTSQNHIPNIGTSSNLPSLTVPDQSLTLRELLTNYTRGHDLPQSNKTPAFFDENEFIPDLKKLDLVDIQELSIANAKKAGKLKTDLNQLQKPLVIHQQSGTENAQ